MKIEAVLFDNDGVLVDSEFLATDVFLAQSRPFGLEMSVFDFNRTFTGMHTEAVVAHFRAERGLLFPVDFMEKLRDAFAHAFHHRLEAIDGMPDLARRLRAKKAVCSNAGTEHLERCMARFDLKNAFGDRVFSAKELPMATKPAPDVFLFGAEKLGTAAEKTIVIEDSVIGMRAAKAAGMRAIGVLAGRHIDAGHADRLREVGADFLAETAEEVEQILRKIGLAEN